MVKFNLKKKIAKALVFAMVMGTVGVHGTLGAPVATVEAATATPAEIKVDYVNFRAEITAGDNGETDTKKQVDRYVFLEVLKENKADAKVSATYCYKVETIAADVGVKTTAAFSGVIVDLSFLKATKDAYIRVRGDVSGSKPDKIVTVKAQPTKLKLKYDVASQKLADGNDQVNVAGSAYEWKSLYGSEWTSFNANTLANFNVAGTTILVRKAAVNNADATKETLASPEAKVKIPAIPKAPNVKVDYVKGTVTIPKDTQVAVLKTSDKTSVAESSFTVNSAATSYSLDDLAKKFGVTDADKEAGYTLVVRSKATDKKAASALAFVKIDPSVKIKDADGKVVIDDGDKDDTNDVEVLIYVGSSKGVTITAKMAIQYSVDEGKKWSNLAAGATKEVKAKDGEKIYVRIAGTKATGDVVAKFPSVEEFITCETAPAKINLVASSDTSVTSAKAADTATTVTFDVTILDANGTDITARYAADDAGLAKLTANSSNTGLLAVTGTGNGFTASSDKKKITLTGTVTKGLTNDGNVEVDVSIGNDVKSNKVKITIKKAAE